MYIKENARPRLSAGLVQSFFLAALLVAVIGLIPNRAHAVDRYLGRFTAPAGATFEQKVGAGSFQDVYSFAFLSSNSVGLIGASVGAIGITNLMVGLWSNGSEIEATHMYAGSSTNFSAFTDLPTNNIYELRVAGYASDPHGGAYSGAFGILATGTETVSPAPEPEIYAMMGIGLAVMGWVGRRRRKQQAALITP